MKLSKELMYDAIVRKDTTFEGVFFTAVKTTGIFCRPSCTARKPKKENVEFYTSTKECIAKGFRPCKVCYPLETLNYTPPEIQKILDEIQSNPQNKIKDLDVEHFGLEPSFLRRWFIKNHGMTFHAFQRMYRINSAFKKIQQGETITNSAFDSGYESLSGFNDSFKNIFGVSPKNGIKQTIIDYKKIETTLGTMVTCVTKNGLCLLEFADNKMLETELELIAKQYNATIIQGQNPLFDEIEKQLNEYFEGQRIQFTIELDIIGTDFQQKVWKTLQTIPYGEMRSCKEQALLLNLSKSMRAVANANRKNRISIIIPCHRISDVDGKLTSYGGGIWRKEYLLNLEHKKNLYQK